MAGPIAVLLAWSMIMWAWLYAVRIPALRRAGIDLRNRVGGTGQDLDQVLAPEIQWKAHNYNHLMEQPTLFYAASLMLIAIGAECYPAIVAAWAYVGLRIAHSLVQSLSNRIMLRFPLFMLASIALAVLIGVVVCAVFFGKEFSS
ncbi:MAG: MAPEG family protein [Sphingomicrobium sp.]